MQRPRSIGGAGELNPQLAADSRHAGYCPNIGQRFRFNAATCASQLLSYLCSYPHVVPVFPGCQAFIYGAAAERDFCRLSWGRRNHGNRTPVGATRRNRTGTAQVKRMKSPGRLHTTVSHTHRRASQNAGAIHFPRYAPLRGGANLEAPWCGQAELNRFTQGLPEPA